MSSQPFGASKQHGVICIHPGCFRFLQTTKYKQHYEAHHLKDGESYGSHHRDDYERALLDPNLLEFGEDGPLKAVFVASLNRVSHYLEDLAARIEKIESAVVARASTPAPTPASESAAAPAPPEAVVSVATNEIQDEHVQESETEEEAPRPTRKQPKRARTQPSQTSNNNKKNKKA